MKIPVSTDALPDRGGKPSVRELLSSVNFNPIKGMIDLSGARIVMQRANVGHLMREALRDLLGEEETRVFLLRQGYLSGRTDARFVQENWPQLGIGDAFTAGTRLHTFTGTVQVETVHNDFDFRRGTFSGEFIWHNSVEAEQIARTGLRTAEPCCWTLVGYASGYATEFFGKPIFYKEMSCVAQGKASCRVIGKPLSDWKADDPAVIRFATRVLPREAGRPAPHTASTRRQPSDDAIVAPVRDSVMLRRHAGTGCILSGPPDSGRRHVLDALICPDSTTPVWHDGATLTVAELLASLKSTKQPVLIDRIDLCSAEVQRHLAANPSPSPFFGLTTLSLAGLRTAPQIEPAFFSRLAVSLVVMPGLAEREATERMRIVAQLAAQVAQQMPTPRIDDDTVAALAQADALTGLSQITGVLQRQALLNESLPESIAALSRPRQDQSDDPRIAAWIDATLTSGFLDLDAVERKIRAAALAIEGGNLAAAARRLGLTRAQLAYRERVDASSD